MIVHLKIQKFIKQEYQKRKFSYQYNYKLKKKNFFN